MILYVYSKKYGVSSTDTSQYEEGNFRLIYTGAQGKTCPLVNVEREGANWVIYENAQVRIAVNHEHCQSLVMEPGVVCELTTSSRDVYFLLCADESMLKGEVQLYSLPAAGTVSIGREGGDISYPFGLVSRNHAVLRIDQGKVILEDNASTNGTFLNNMSIQRHELEMGDTIDLFGLRIACLGSKIAVAALFAPVKVSGLQPYRAPRSPVSPAGSAATLFMEEDDLFERAPRIAMKQNEERLRIDEPPAANKQEEMPLVFTVGSSALMSMSSLMMAMTSLQNVQATGGSFLQALPSVFMAGGMLLGGLAMPVAIRKYTDKRNQAKEETRQQKFLAYLGENEQRIAQIGEKQKEYLLTNYPDNNVLQSRVAERSPLVWGRMPRHRDFLDLRLGTATLPVDVHIDYPNHRFSLDEDVMRKAIQDFEEKPRVIDNSPFVLSLKETGILGIYAAYEHRMRYVQGLLMQLCAQHSYTEMKLVLIYDKNEEQAWEWARWLPHLWDDNREFRAIGTDLDDMRSLSAYIDSLSAPADVHSDADPDVHCVVVVSDMHLAEQCPALAEGMRSIHSRALSVIALADRANLLPRECKSVVTLNEEEGYLYRDIDQLSVPVRFVQDPLPQAALRSFSAQLGRMRLASGNRDGELPDVLSFYEMMRWGNVAQSDLIARWQQSNPIKTLAAAIGVDGHGDKVMLDIHQKAHGPHGLVAGMTGSGKSELLITYLLSMAVQYSPLEVGFVIIDYKGGGMSDTLKDLPHVVGVIDNLGGRAGIRRSMNSLESELKRRQRVFKEVGERTKNSNLDIHRYQKLFRDGKVDEPMQHIIIISDEFAELKQQEPEFMDYLVSAARIGRSLGVHLILATQKPSGVVNDQIMSNTRFRVCMKVQDKSDSMEMLSRPDAAMLTKTGRFYLQVGFNEIYTLGQSAWSGAPSIPKDRYREEPDQNLEMISDNGSVIMRAKLPSPEDGVKRTPQVDELVSFIRKTAEEHQLMPEKIWKPMLTDNVLLDEIDREHQPEYKPGCVDPVVGMLDDPFLQQQAPLQLDLTNGGNAVLYGVTGSGKSDFVSAAIYSLCMHHSAREVNIYCLDFAAETAKMFSNMPQVGAVVIAGEDEKIQSLMRLLTEEVTRRRRLLSAYAGSLEVYREENPNADMPSILLVADNYTAFAEGYPDYEELMYQIVREGPRFGIYTLVTCVSSSSMRYRMAQNFKQIFCLQMPDKSDYTLLLGSNNGALPLARAGSGVCRRDGRVVEFQVGKLRHKDPRQTRLELLELGQTMQATSGLGQARKVRTLPETVTLQMICEDHPQTVINAVPIGIDKTTFAVTTWNMASRFINQIGYSDQPEYNFLASLTAVLARDSKRSVVCLDPTGTLGVTAAGNVSVYNGAQLLEGAENFLYTCLERNNAIKTAIEEKQPVPQYDEYVLVVNGMAELFDMLKMDQELSDGMNVAFSKADVLMRANPQMNMYLVFTQNVARLGALNSMGWYRDAAQKDGLWLGDGVRKQYMLTSDGIERNEKTPEGPFGYLIRYGKPTCVKLVTG